MTATHTVRRQLIRVPIGDNGLSITATGGNFLSAVTLDGNGSPWVLVTYSPHSNRDRGSRFFLYRLSDNHWSLAGPQNGLESEEGGSATLHFCDESTLVLSLLKRDPNTGKSSPRVFALRENTWQEAPPTFVIPEDSRIVTCDNVAYVIRQVGQAVDVYEFPETFSRPLPPAKRTLALPDGLRMRRIFIDHGRPAAIFATSQRGDCILLYSGDEESSDPVKVDPPDDRYLIDIKWDRNRQMLLATCDLDDAKVYMLEKRTWKLLAYATEDSGAFIHSPLFTLLNDEKPVVTWEAFFPH